MQKYKYAEIADNGCGQVVQFVAPRLHPLIHSGLIIIAQCIYIAMMVGVGVGSTKYVHRL